MIVGATDASDATILEQASSLYARQRLRRVYYSAFSPIPDASSKLPLQAPPLVREHRLYQADWLVRFYGFAARELTTEASPNLDLTIDPKLAWALRHPASVSGRSEQGAAPSPPARPRARVRKRRADLAHSSLAPAPARRSRCACICR